VRGAEVPQQRILEAVRGAILARGAAGTSLLVEQLQSADRSMFTIALRTSRERAGEDVTQALLAVLVQLPPDRQIPLISNLAERESEAVLPEMLKMAKSGASDVRPVAIEMLGQIGNASCIATLLEIASDSNADLANAAKSALETMPGSDVDAELAKRLTAAKGTTRHVLIELAGLRRVDAVPALISAIDDADAKIRAAALAALGSTLGPNDLPVLIGRVASPKHSEDTAAAQRALREACVRMPDRDACVQQLVTAMGKAPPDAQNALLETIGHVGGSAALRTLATAATGPQPELRDTASRLLGGWMTEDAAPVLLDLAKSGADDRYRTRALRGYLRITRQFKFPAAKRVEMCRGALQAATRDAERVLVLEVLEQNPSLDALRLAVEVGKSPTLKNQAVAASLAIAQKLGQRTAEIESLLAELGMRSMKIEILQAEYGAGSNVRDVTDSLKEHVRDLPWVVLPSPSYNANFGGDPAPGVVKQLKIRYRLDNQSGEVSLPENSPIILPIPEKRS
jgi:HEAT repeat protein